MGTAGEPTGDEVRTSTARLVMHRGQLYAYRNTESEGAIDLVAPAGSTPSSEFEQLDDGTFVLRAGLGLHESIFLFTVLGIEHPDPMRGVLSSEPIVQRRTLAEITHCPPRFPLAVNVREQPPVPNTDRLVTDLTVAVAGGAPAGWRRVEIDCAAAGREMVLTAKVTLTDGTESHWSPPAIVGQWFHRLRVLAHRPGHGSWFTAKYAVDSGAPATIEYGHDEHPALSAADYFEDLRYLPRKASAIPDWLRERALTGYEDLLGVTPPYAPPVPAPAKPYSLETRLFDGLDAHGRPYQYRPAIAEAEQAALLSYMDNGFVAMASRGFVTDLLDPDRKQTVPMAFLTDGEWVWSAAAAYYLREHSVPPPPDFVDHIRSRNYELPRSVPRIAMDRATSVAWDRPENDAQIKDDLDRALFVVADFAIRYQISRRRYAVGEVRDQAWCMVREGDRYAAFWYWAQDDRREFETVFDTASMASVYLIGQLYQNYPDLQRDPGEIMEAWEVLAQPTPPDPHLSYFTELHYINVEDLEAEVFGTDETAYIYAVGTRFDQILPPQGDISPEPRRIRLNGKWNLVSCVLPPTEQQPDGAQAYLLPRRMSAYLPAGQIVVLSDATAGPEGQ